MRGVRRGRWRRNCEKQEADYPNAAAIRTQQMSLHLHADTSTGIVFGLAPHRSILQKCESCPNLSRQRENTLTATARFSAKPCRRLLPDGCCRNPMRNYLTLTPRLLSCMVIEIKATYE